MFNLDIPIDEVKKIEKVITGLPYRFREKVNILTNFFKACEFKINVLISDLQSYEIHHFLHRKSEIVAEKEKTIALKSTKGSGSNK